MQYHKLESILSVAKSLFAKYGPRKTSLEEVARIARVAKGTIYNYFGSKDRVYLEVLTREAHEVIEGIREEIKKGKNPIEELRGFIFARFHHLGNALNLIKVDKGEEHFPEAKRVKEKFFQQEILLLEEILHKGKEKGIFWIKEPHSMARSILVGLRGFEDMYVRGEDRKNLERLLHDFTSLILKGMLYKSRGN